MKVAFTFRFATTELFRAYNGDGTRTWLERKGLKFVQAALGKFRPLQTLRRAIGATLSWSGCPRPMIALDPFYTPWFLGRFHTVL